MRNETSMYQPRIATLAIYLSKEVTKSAALYAKFKLDVRIEGWS